MSAVRPVIKRPLQNRKSRVCANNPDVHKQIEAAQKKAKQEFQQQLGILAQRTQRREQQTTQLKSSLANVEKRDVTRLQPSQPNNNSTLKVTPGPLGSRRRLLNCQPLDYCKS